MISITYIDRDIDIDWGSLLSETFMHILDHFGSQKKEACAAPG